MRCTTVSSARVRRWRHPRRISSRRKQSGRSPDQRPSSSDFLDRLDLPAQAEQARFAPGLRDRGVDSAAARRVVQVRDDLIRSSRRLPGARQLPDEEPDEDLMRVAWILSLTPIGWFAAEGAKSPE